jgi:hypothetical protein
MGWFISASLLAYSNLALKQFGPWPSFLVWSLSWLYASSVENKKIWPAGLDVELYFFQMSKEHLDVTKKFLFEKG